MRALVAVILFMSMVLCASAGLAAGSARRGLNIDETARATNGLDQILAIEVFYHAAHKSRAYLVVSNASETRPSRRLIGRGISPRTLALGANDELFLAGDFVSRGRLRGKRLKGGVTFSAFAAKLTTDLKLEWVNVFNSMSASVFGAVLEGQTNFTVYGFALSNLSISGITVTNRNVFSSYVATLDTNGTARTLWFSDQSVGDAARILFDSNVVYVAGNCDFRHPAFGGGVTNFVATNRCLFLARYARSGEFQWVVAIEDPLVQQFSDLTFTRTTEKGGDLSVHVRFLHRIYPNGTVESGHLFLIIGADGTVLDRNVFVMSRPPPP